MSTYDELKAELEVMSKLVEKFPESVKPKVFDLLVQTFLGHTPPAAPPEAPAIENTSISSPAMENPIKKMKKKTSKQEIGNGDAAKKATKRGAGKESYSIDRNLNLRGDKSIPSFNTFLEEKKPTSAKEINAVVVYYLQKMLGLQQITLNHAYTCYAEAKRRPPEAFRQSFIDTKNREGWVEFDGDGNLRVPHRGSVFVEHDLPRQEKAKKS